MIRIILSSIAALAIMLYCVGCSQDAIQILDHPKQVAPSAQFEVSIVNQFFLIMNGATVSSAVNRDSLHLVVGLPDGYSVVAAKYYFAKDLDFVKLSMLADTTAAKKILNDSLAVYKTRAVAMQTAPQFVSLLKHRSYIATNANDTLTDTVKTDSVKTWSSWAGKVDIAIPTGITADTLIDTLGVSLGVISKPVFLWITLRAKTSVGLDTLFYFTKTATLPALTDTSSTDIGKIQYSPLLIGNSAIQQLNPLKQNRSALSIHSYPGSSTIIIKFGEGYKDATALEVFNVSGIKVLDLSSSLKGSNGSLSWNTKNSNLKSGMYILRLKTKNDIVSTPMRVLE